MKIFIVERMINGKLFSCDEDRILAQDWNDAEHMLRIMALPHAQIGGELVHEEKIETDLMLDIMLDNKLSSYRSCKR